MYSFVLDIRKIRICVCYILKFLDIESSIEIKLTGDDEIEMLNKKFLKVEGPTNVLSFPSNEKDFLGSICISVDTICREAHLYDQNIEEYFYQMLIYGILHLMGYEHGDEMLYAHEKVLEYIKNKGCISNFDC